VDLLLIIVIILVSLFITIQLWAYIKSKKLAGKKIPFDEIDEEIAEEIKDKTGLIYFFSPRCHNCKIQSPIIEDIKKSYKNIISIDASKNINIARTFNIMGTPSILIFSGNKIMGYFVGIKKKLFIEKQLNSN